MGLNHALAAAGTQSACARRPARRRHWRSNRHIPASSSASTARACSCRRPPPAAVADTSLEAALARLLPDGAGEAPLNHPVLPFRRVASDLLGGEMVVLADTPLSGEEELGSSFGVARPMLHVLTQQNVRRSLQELGAAANARHANWHPVCRRWRCRPRPVRSLPARANDSPQGRMRRGRLLGWNWCRRRMPAARHWSSGSACEKA
jgi:hypothetical protein